MYTPGRTQPLLSLGEVGAVPVSLCNWELNELGLINVYKSQIQIFHYSYSNWPNKTLFLNLEEYTYLTLPSPMRDTYSTLRSAISALTATRRTDGPT